MVHAVVPHHHHNKIFTSVVDFLGEDTNSLFNHHDVKFDHHVNDVVISTYHTQQSTVDVLPLYTHPIGDLIFHQADYLSGIPIILKPYLTFSYSAVITNSLGLRAPPCC